MNKYVDFFRNNKAPVIVVMGALLIILGSILPSTYDLWGDPHGMMNSPEVGLTIITICIIIVCAVAYSEFSKDARISRRIWISLLVLSILFLLTSTFFTFTWNIATVNREVSFGPGLYIIFAGTVLFLVGSIIAFRRSSV